MENGENLSSAIEKLKVAISECDEFLHQLDRHEEQLEHARKSGLNQFKEKEKMMKTMYAEALSDYMDFWDNEKAILQDMKELLLHHRRKWNITPDAEQLMSNPEMFEQMLKYIEQVSNLNEIQFFVPLWKESNILQKLTFADLGYFKYEEFEPEDLVMKIETSRSKAVVGNVISGNIISLRGKISGEITKELAFSVRHKAWSDPERKVDTFNNTLDPESRMFRFDFHLSKVGIYTISALLYGHDVIGSPCTLPVYIVPADIALENCKAESSTQSPTDQEVKLRAVVEPLVSDNDSIAQANSAECPRDQEIEPRTVIRPHEKDKMSSLTNVSTTLSSSKEGPRNLKILYRTVQTQQEEERNISADDDQNMTQLTSPAECIRDQEIELSTPHKNAKISSAEDDSTTQTSLAECLEDQDIEPRTVVVPHANDQISSATKDSAILYDVQKKRQKYQSKSTLQNTEKNSPAQGTDPKMSFLVAVKMLEKLTRV